MGAFEYLCDLLRIVVVLEALIVLNRWQKFNMPPMPPTSTLLVFFQFSPKFMAFQLSMPIAHSIPGNSGTNQRGIQNWAVRLSCSG